MNNTKHVKLIFDTRDGVKLDGTSIVSWNISDMIKDIRAGSIQYTQLYSMEMINTFYNIIETNSTFAFDVYDAGGTVFQRQTIFTISDGYYTSDQLFTEVLAQMNANDADVYTLTTNPINDKVTISNTSGRTIQFNFVASTIGRVFGFTKDSAIGASITTDRMPDTRGLTSIMIKSNLGIGENMIRYTGASGTNDGFSYEVKMTEPYGSTVFWHNNNPLDIQRMSNLPSVVKVELRNRKTALISNNNFDYKFCLLVAYTV